MKPIHNTIAIQTGIFGFKMFNSKLYLNFVYGFSLSVPQKSCLDSVENLSGKISYLLKQL
jgi:hypothetical protein